MELEFPLLGDWPRNETCRKYGTYLEERFISARRTFIVDRGGVVRHIIDDARDFPRHSREALEWAQRLQKEPSASTTDD